MFCIIQILLATNAVITVCSQSCAFVRIVGTKPSMLGTPLDRDYVIRLEVLTVIVEESKG